MRYIIGSTGLLVLALTRSMTAQPALSPYFGLAWGVHQIRVSGFTSSHGAAAEDQTQFVGRIEAGFGLGSHTDAEVSVQRVFGDKKGFLAVGVSAGLRTHRPGGAYVRLGAARLQSDGFLDCVVAFGCPDYGSTKRAALTGAIGLDIQRGRHFVVGPALTFAYSLQRQFRYRTIGLGVRFART